MMWDGCVYCMDDIGLSSLLMSLKFLKSFPSSMMSILRNKLL
jgi:hypothetical protein